MGLLYEGRDQLLQRFAHILVNTIAKKPWFADLIKIRIHFIELSTTYSFSLPHELVYLYRYDDPSIAQ